MRVGIIGTGWIAEKAAITLNGLAERARKGDASAAACEAFAVGSRTLDTAQAFASKWGIPRAYGSYAELIADPDVDLVYIGTPHSHHYDVTKAAIEAGKPCLVEKAFMANARQTQEILNLAHERGVFVAEAIWTRYQPAVGIVRQFIADGRIGQPRLITATLGYSMGDKERIMRPDLCGGALLDLGVYALNFVRMFCGTVVGHASERASSGTMAATLGGVAHYVPTEIVSIDGHCVKSDTGMDLTNAMTIILKDGILANVQSSAQCVGDNIGVIAGTEGNLIIDNINNPQTVTVNGPDRTYVETVHVPTMLGALQRSEALPTMLQRSEALPTMLQRSEALPTTPLTGYEYQFLACRDALAEGLLEPREMPHAETLYIMQLMDGLRAKWGVRYPMD